MFGKIIDNVRFVAIIGAAILLLGSSATTIGPASSVALATQDNINLDEIESGNLIINYIYEIELENSDDPKIELDRDTVEQGDDVAVNGSNFHDDSRVRLSIFEEELLAIMDEDGNLAERSAAVLLTKADVEMSDDNGDDVRIENDERRSRANNGTVMLVTNISPSDVSSAEYDLNLECDNGPDGTNFEFPDQLVVDNSSAKQFFELSLPAGDYEQCQIVMSPDGNNETIESAMMNFTVAPEDVTSVRGTMTDGEGSFLQDVTVAFNAEPDRYVLMTETSDGQDSKKAIAPLTIVDEGTSTAGEEDEDNSSARRAGSGGTLDHDTDGSTNSGGSNGNWGGSSGGGTPGEVNNGGTPGSDNNNGGTSNNGGGSNSGGGNNPPDSGSQGPPPPEDNCQEVTSGTDNVNNTIVQSSSQSASNSYSDDDVINVVQKISGTYNGTGHVNTSVAIDDSDTVTQQINQDIDQDATIKKCGDDQSSAGSNQTNTIDMNATQLASNAYSDNTTVIIVQTIIIPKYCNTNVNAPVSVSDRDTVTQTVDQNIDQNGEIRHGSGGGGSGSNTNTVTQTSMQVAGNNATNDQVITINQVIIVPPDCPVEVYAPVVVEGNDNIQMTVSQTSAQDANIDTTGGVTVSNSVTAGEQPTYTTNTVVMVGSQDGQNSFSDNDNITIEQNIYYVNDTAGWTEENYEENLAEEFGNSTAGDTSNSTSPAANSTMTEDGDGNSTSSEESDGMMMAAMSIDSTEEDVVIEDDNSGNSTDDTETFVVVEESGYSEPPIEEDAGGEGQPTPDNSTASVDSGESLSADPPAEVAEESSSEPTPETDTTTEPETTTSDPVDNSDTTTVDAPSEPPAPEEAPPAETNSNEITDTDGTTEGPAPVDSQEADATSGNSTSTA